jgi:hypothetical protein
LSSSSVVDAHRDARTAVGLLSGLMGVLATTLTALRNAQKFDVKAEMFRSAAGAWHARTQPARLAGLRLSWLLHISIQCRPCCSLHLRLFPLLVGIVLARAIPNIGDQAGAADSTGAPPPFFKFNLSPSFSFYLAFCACADFCCSCLIAPALVERNRGRNARR